MMNLVNKSSFLGAEDSLQVAKRDTNVSLILLVLVLHLVLHLNVVVIKGKE